MMPSETEVRAALNAIVDPCSEAAGVPAGLDDMGLIRRVTIEAGRDGHCRVAVVVAVTEFGCLMGAPFADAAYHRLSALPGVSDVDVALDDRFDWSERDMADDYRARLAAHRQARRAAQPHPQRSSGAVERPLIRH